MSAWQERLWLWGHEAGSHNGGWGLPATSRMTPAEASHYMGIPNVIMVRYGGRPAPPHDQHALGLSSVDRVVWSVVGDGSTTDAPDEALGVADLARRFDNIRGVMMDDFFERRGAGGERQLAAHTPAALAAMKAQLRARAGRDLDLWVVLYGHQLELPVAEHLAQCDVITFWSWTAEQLGQTRERLARVRQLAPAARLVLGCYMWDYGNGRQMPAVTMQAQIDEGAALVEAGQVEGLIFLASCICDLPLPAVDLARRWVRQRLATG